MDRAHEPLGPLLSRAARAARPTRLTPRAARGKVVDRELEAGTRAHFEDAAYYSQNYAWRTADIAYYAQLARELVAAQEGREARGRVPSILEYGIGNGRIAIPMARAGARVVGVDLSEAMLADLRVRLQAEPPEVRARVTAKRGDMRSVRLREKFALVIAPFNAILHLYTRQDVEAWLARVKEHLAPGGALVFDITVPEAEDLARDPTKEFRAPGFRHPSAGRVRYHEHFDYDRLRQILFVSMVFQPKDGESFVTPLAHRQFYPQEMEALLHYNGFAITRLEADFGGEPLHKDAETMTIHAEGRGRRGARDAGGRRGRR